MNTTKNLNNLENPFINAILATDHSFPHYGLNLLKYLVDNNIQQKYNINDPLYIETYGNGILKTNIAHYIMSSPKILYEENSPKDIINTIQILINSGLNIQYNIEEYYLANENGSYHDDLTISHRDKTLKTQPKINASIKKTLSRHEEFSLFILKNIKQQLTQEEFKQFIYDNELIHQSVQSQLYKCIDYLVNTCELDINVKNTRGEIPIMFAENNETLTNLNNYKLDWTAENNEQLGLLNYFNRIQDTKTSTPMITNYFKQTKNLEKDPKNDVKMGINIQNAIDNKKPNSEIFLLMKNYKGDLNNIRNENNETILITAIKREKWSLASQIMDKIDINIQTNDNKNVLLYMLDHKSILGMGADNAPIILSYLIKKQNIEHSDKNISYMINMLLYNNIPNYIIPTDSRYQSTNVKPSNILTPFISAENANKSLSLFNKIQFNNDNKSPYTFSFFIHDYTIYTKIPCEKLSTIINDNLQIFSSTENLKYHEIYNIQKTLTNNLNAIFYLAEINNIVIKDEIIEKIADFYLDLGLKNKTFLRTNGSPIIDYISNLYTKYQIAPREDLYLKLNNLEECDPELKTIINQSYLNNKINDKNEVQNIKKNKI